MNIKAKLLIVGAVALLSLAAVKSAQAATFLNVSLNNNQPAGQDLNFDEIGLGHENAPVWLVTLNLTNSASSTEPLNVNTLYISTATGTKIIFSRMFLSDNENHQAIRETNIKSGPKSLVFRNLNYVIQVGETKVVQVWGYLDGTLTNDYNNQLGITARGGIIARGARDRRNSTVSGNWPVVGNVFRLVLPRSYCTVSYAGNNAVVTVARGAANVELIRLVFNNEERSGNDMFLDSVKITNYGTANNNRTLSSVGLYDGDRLLVRGTLAGRVYTFRNINFTIDRGTNHVFIVKGNISRNATVGQTIIMGVNAIADLRGHNANPNGAGLATIFGGNFPIRANEIRIAGNGQLGVRAESNPASTNVVAGTALAPMLNLRFTASTTPFNINRLRISQTNDAAFNRSINSVTISYQNEAGQTISSTQNLIGGNADFNITNNPAYIPVNASRAVSVFANLAAINQTYAAYTGDIIKLTFRAAQGFSARAVGVNQAVIQNVGNQDISGYDMVVHGNVPTIEADAQAGNLQNGSAQLYRFKVTAAEGTDLSLKKLSFKLQMTDSVINTATLYLQNFEILEGPSYNDASALTQADQGADSYRIFDAWSNARGSTTTTQTGNLLHATHISDARAYLYQNNAAYAGRQGQGATNTHDIIVVFNDDRLIRSGESKYFILRATAGNVDTGAQSNDSISTYMYDGDTQMTDRKFLTASCDFYQTNCRASKYGLSTEGRDDGARRNDSGAYFIWSDNTGTNGNMTHVDTATGRPESSPDWFNGWKIKNLDVQRTLN